MSVKYSCQMVATLLRKHGVTRAVLSPGSRNAPLLLALDAEPEIECLTVVDERSAAFAALGMAQVSREPVAIVCTSGTALLNYAPAVAEAFYQHLPLIVITADRPAQWIDQDDSQTIHQPDALANFVKFNANLSDYDDPDGEEAWYAGRQMNDALIAAKRVPRAPVHVNVQLAEPLTADYPELNSVKYIDGLCPEPELSYSDVQALAASVRCKRLMVVAGFMPPSHLMTRAMKRLAALPNVVVLTEAMANIHCPEAVNTVDRILALIDRDDTGFRPDVVVSVGGALVSRHLKAWLRECKQMEHWSVGPGTVSADVFKHLTRCIRVEPAPFLAHFASALEKSAIDSDYSFRWKSLAESDLKRHSRKVSTAPWSSLKAFSIIWPAIPDGTNVQLSNGTCVRYAQFFVNPDIHACYCNRGVSGIDGCTSTAAGASMVYEGMTLLITGDMSFAYDLNALQMSAASRLKIVVINNGGGGIFRFIGSTRAVERREELFCANPRLRIVEVADAMGITCFKASSEGELRRILPQFFSAPGRTLLEITVDADEDARAITDYFL